MCAWWFWLADGSPHRQGPGEHEGVSQCCPRWDHCGGKPGAWAAVGVGPAPAATSKAASRIERFGVQSLCARILLYCSSPPSPLPTTGQTDLFLVPRSCCSFQHRGGVRLSHFSLWSLCPLSYGSCSFSARLFFRRNGSVCRCRFGEDWVCP